MQSIRPTAFTKQVMNLCHLRLDRTGLDLNIYSKKRGLKSLDICVIFAVQRFQYIMSENILSTSQSQRITPIDAAYAKNRSELRDFIDEKFDVSFQDSTFSMPIEESSEIRANQQYFDQPKWARTYLKYCHRDTCFRERWQAAAGSWDDKIIVDIGCGPGNLYATLGGTPKLLIGVDISQGSLKIAREMGYTTLLADGHRLPLISGFADLVVVNATLHHCENMAVVLAEAARLVRAGGKLVVDHDPQLTAWHYRGLGLFLYRIRLSIIYRFFLKKLHMPLEERLAALETEIHHRPGHGVTVDLFYDTLSSEDFTVNIYPHNNAVGAGALDGDMGDPPHWRYRVGQILSGINPFVSTSALSLMCVSSRKMEGKDTAMCHE